MTDSYQIPPPLANFSYPPSNRDQFQFNFLDSFATSWVTPQFSTEPCFLSLYYWNSSAPKAPWTSKFNHSTQLNGTEIVSLQKISSDGLGQLNLNYVDPVGGHKLALGAIFHINHDTTQPKAITWNQNALSSSSKSLPASSPPTLSVSTLAALSTSKTSVPTAANTVSLPVSSTPTLSASALATLSTSKTPVPTAANTLSLPATVTAIPSAGKSASSSPGARVASIVLGTVLGLVLAAALVMLMLWTRRRRWRRTTEQAIPIPLATPLPVHATTSAMQEKDAGVASSELRAGNGRWELDAGKP